MRLARVLLTGTAAVLAPLAWTGSAHAATATIVYSETGQGSSYNFALTPTYSADPGEANQLTVTSGQDESGEFFLLFTDPGAVIQASEECVAVDPHRARCAGYEVSTNYADVSLGDGDDTLRTNAITTASGGRGDDIIVGSSEADVLFGNQGSDSIRGGLEEDTLDGGRGPDTVLGGPADDVVADGGGSRDTIDGGPGRDLLDLSSRRRALRVDLASGVSGESGEDDTIQNLEKVFGGQANDVLIGDARANRLLGLSGDDRLRGGPGRDGLNGGLGDDVLRARDGQRDIVWGGRGRDAVRWDRRVDFLANIERVF